jgi:hypothetical protein
MIKTKAYNAACGVEGDAKPTLTQKINCPMRDPKNDSTVKCYSMKCFGTLKYQLTLNCRNIV